MSVANGSTLTWGRCYVHNVCQCSLVWQRNDFSGIKLSRAVCCMINNNNWTLKYICFRNLKDVKVWYDTIGCISPDPSLHLAMTKTYLCCSPQPTHLMAPFPPSLSRPSPLLYLRVCFVWQLQPRWWRGWRSVWIKAWSTTASSAWILMQWPVMLCPFFSPVAWVSPCNQLLWFKQPSSSSVGSK